MENEGINVLLLNVEGRSFGVEVHQVETLRRKETVFPTHEGPPELLGFLPFGKASVPIIDLGVRLKVLRKSARLTGLLVVPPQDVAPVAFRVDKVTGPIHLPWQQLALLPEMLCEMQSRAVTWAMAWQGETIIPLLDLAQVVPPEEVAALIKFTAGASA